MADIYCNDGYKESIGGVVAGGAIVGKVLRLYANDYTPVLAEAPGNFTESTIAGYAGIALVPATWVDASAGGHEIFTYPTQTFSMTGAGSVYGYYVTDAGATKVFWAGRFPSAPFTFPAGGGTLNGTLELDGP